jgi:hypothetical protein
MGLCNHDVDLENIHSRSTTEPCDWLCLLPLSILSDYFGRSLIESSLSCIWGQSYYIGICQLYYNNSNMILKHFQREDVPFKWFQSTKRSLIMS